jgi:hypothetical protein
MGQPSLASATEAVVTAGVQSRFLVAGVFGVGLAGSATGESAGSFHDRQAAVKAQQGSGVGRPDGLEDHPELLLERVGAASSKAR